MKTITMAQAQSGQNYLAQYCMRMLGLKAHLSINHHLAMHFAQMIRLFGPVYAWWLFAFERFNGMLEKVNLNGHDGGRLELTQMRSWTLNHLLYELLLSLPANAPEQERALIYQIIDGEAKRGAMAIEIQMFRAEASVDTVQLPRQITRPINLHRTNLRHPTLADPPLYEILFLYLKTRWPNLRRQFSLEQGEHLVPFIGDRAAHRLPYIRKDGLRYGTQVNTRSQKDTHVFVIRNGARVPVAIEDMFLIKVEGLNEPVHACLLVRPLREAPQDLNLPWKA